MIYFVTGTDTDVGKTFVCSGLLQASKGQSLGIKPIAAGCHTTEAGLRNDDALVLIQSSTIKLAYSQVNPIALAPAIAPHIAARQVGLRLSCQRLSERLPRPAMARADLCLVEGAGGWRLPLGDGQYLSDWVKQQGWPVIVVVGMKLGCLNHAILTAEAIQADGLEIAGWIANQIEPNMPCYAENLATLQAAFPAPMLAEVPYMASCSGANHLLDAAQQLGARMVVIPSLK